MPNSHIIQKAGKWTFLLVCLFLCSACGREKAVFRTEKTPVRETEKVRETEPFKEAESFKEPEPHKEQENNEKNLSVNINTAGVAELMSLPGIGQVRAEAIIAYRESEGEFETIDGIMNVRGIKQGIFSKISSFICVK